MVAYELVRGGAEGEWLHWLGVGLRRKWLHVIQLL